MSDQERNEQGQYTESITIDDIKKVFRELTDPREPLTAVEVAETLDCDRKTAYNKLWELAEDNVLQTKKVGARARIWWQPDERELIQTSEK